MRSSLRRQLLHLATDLSALAANPDDLGHGFDLLTRSYPTPVADAARAALRSDGDDTWLHQRVRHTHDLWHVVCGCPPTAAGEAAMSAVNVMQLRWPGSAMLLGANLLHRCLEGPNAGEVDAGQAAAYGLELGRVCAPLLAQRWEEGWDQPLAK